MKKFLKLLTSLASLVSKSVPVTFRGGPLNITEFNEKFVSGNKALAAGNTEGLKTGIGLFIESLSVSGNFGPEMKKAIEFLYRALSHHDRADTKGPWNRDLSGYGLFSWKNDLWSRDTALRNAWPHIDKVNRELKSKGLGWNY